MKRKVLILTTLMLGMCQGIPVYAAEPIAVAKAEEGVMPLYEHIRSISTVIDEKNGNVSCGVAVTLQESGKIEITMKLKRKTSTGWKTLETWNSSKTGIKFNYSETKALSDVSNLRVYSQTKVTVNGVSETITQTDRL